MVNSVSNSNNINSVQMFSAVNAFKSIDKPKESNITEPSEGINLNDDNLMKDQNVNEIRLFAKMAGEDNLSNDDIQYGLTYGRSVIADYMI